jgi:ribonucleoside-diphosphate reductase alpha chain
MQTESTDNTTESGGQPAAEQSVPGPQPPVSPALKATAPGQLKVIKRNGHVVGYDDSKIAVAMTKAFLAVEGGTAAASSRIRELVANLVGQVSATFARRLPSGGTLHIEEIQDQVELCLMRSGEQKVARDYVLYREERARLRAEKTQAPSAATTAGNLMVTLGDGSRAPLDMERLTRVVSEACEGLSDVDDQRIISEALANMYDGISEPDVATSVLITARTLVEEEPNYTYVSARLLLDQLRTEALTFLGVRAPSASPVDYRATQSQMDVV